MKYLLPTLLTCLCLLAPATAADWEPELADQAALGELLIARNALVQLAEQPQGIDYDAAYRAGLAALTALYELHGQRWARPKLEELYQRPECPDYTVGYSRDGRMELSVSYMELRNPAFDGYRFYLCTLRSLSALELRAEDTGKLAVELADGSTLEAEQITAEHPLYPELYLQLDSYSPPAALPAGAGLAFKQVFALPAGLPAPIGAVSLEWGSYRLSCIRYGIISEREVR